MSPLKFKSLVQLFEDLELARRRKANRGLNSEHRIAVNWFRQYDHQIERRGESAVAFLSCMFPERLPHRSYRLREKTLASVISSSLCLGTTRAAYLRNHEDRNVDFATAVEEVIRDAENCPSHEVTLQEIDDALSKVALIVCNGDSSMSFRKRQGDPVALLSPIFRRLRSNEAKWFVRMILKSYSPIQLPEQTILRSFHFLLPELLVVKNSIKAAVTVLGHDNLKHQPHDPPIDQRAGIRQLVIKHLAPELGVMIKRQPYYKARSIQHCYNMTNRRYMSVERKYDGEYCQIHIDRSKTPGTQIQIFSKSGKDSTNDRIRLHAAIAASLRLEGSDCQFRRNCILEGELLIWNRTKQEIGPFHLIRKNVLHGGRFIGNEADSPRRLDEQLMIMFYDVLLIDDIGLLQEPHSTRRFQLEKLVTPIPGLGQICHRELVNFADTNARTVLRRIFAQGIVRRWEGFVLKGNKDPYFTWEESSSVIKLKKDYITGLGDTADLCIIGGRRQQAVVDDLNMGELSWTSFHLCCIENKAQILKDYSTKPMFRILDILDHHNLSKETIQHLNWRGGFLQFPWAESSDHFDVSIDQKRHQSAKPSELFKEPFVVEVMGAGFEKPSDTPYFTLRFPRAKLVRLHTDRTFMDTTTFEELQIMAKESLIEASNSDRKEEAEWIERLLRADGGRQPLETESPDVTPTKDGATTTSVSTLSPESDLTPGQALVYHSPTKAYVDLTNADEPKSGLACCSSTLSGSVKRIGHDKIVSPTTEKVQTCDDTLQSPPPTAESPKRQVRRKLFEAGTVTPPDSSPMEACLIFQDQSDEMSTSAVEPPQFLKLNAPSTPSINRTIQQEQVQPFDPPAVFRMTEKTSKMIRSSQTCKLRQPLAEVSNISPQRTPSTKKNVGMHIETVQSNPKATKRQFHEPIATGRPQKKFRTVGEGDSGNSSTSQSVPQKGLVTSSTNTVGPDGIQSLDHAQQYSRVSAEAFNDCPMSCQNATVHTETHASNPSDASAETRSCSTSILIKLLDTSFPNVAAREIQRVGRSALQLGRRMVADTDDQECQVEATRSGTHLITSNRQHDLIVFLDRRVEIMLQNMDFMRTEDGWSADHGHGQSPWSTSMTTSLKPYFICIIDLSPSQFTCKPRPYPDQGVLNANTGSTPLADLTPTSTIERRPAGRHEVNATSGMTLPNKNRHAPEATSVEVVFEWTKFKAILNTHGAVDRKS